MFHVIGLLLGLWGVALFPHPDLTNISQDGLPPTTPSPTNPYILYISKIELIPALSSGVGQAVNISSTGLGIPVVEVIRRIKSSRPFGATMKCQTVLEVKEGKETHSWLAYFGTINVWGFWMHTIEDVLCTIHTRSTVNAGVLTLQVGYITRKTDDTEGETETGLRD